MVHSVVLAACGAAALAVPIGAAWAQQVQAGTLECRGGPDTGFILAQVTNLNCVLHVDSAQDSRFVAAIENFGVFIGDSEVALIWRVMAPVPWIGTDDLAGTYVSAGANVLVGGRSGSITLRPPDEPKPSETAGALESIEGLLLRPMDRGY